MRLKSKRLVSLLLAGSMMVSMVPASAVTAFAAEAKSVAVMSEDSDVAEPVSLSVTVNAGESLETAVRNAAQSENKNWKNITNLTVITAAGKELNNEDFKFLSGVVVDDSGKGSASAVSPSTDTNAVKYTGVSFDCLTKLETLDLSNATCVENAIPSRAFQYNGSIKTIILPNNLVSIKNRAFSQMTQLSQVGAKSGEVELPATLTTIEEFAFFADSSLDDKLVWPKSLYKIGSACFSGSKISGDLVIPGNIEILPTFEFAGESHNMFVGTNITSLTFEEGIQAISPGFAKNCAQLISITIPHSVTKIGSYAFQSTALTTLPEMSGVTEIETGAFSNIKTFSGTLVIPKNVLRFTGGEGAANPAKVVGAFKDSADQTSAVLRYIIESPDIELFKNTFVGQKAATQIYFTSAKTNTDTYWDNDKVIVLNTDGGEIDISKSFDNTTKLYVPSKAGYTFAGWYADVNDETTKLGGKAENSNDTSACTMYTAKWEADTYTVTVDYAGKGGTNYETNVTYSDTLTEPKHEDVDGYTFGGWYDGDTKVTFPLKVTGNTTLTAKWYLNAAVIEPAAACKVTVENGTAWVGDQQVEFVAPGETVTIKANQDIVDGMKFSHWEVRKGNVELKDANVEKTTFVMPAEPVEVAVMLKDETSDDGLDAATVVAGVAIGAGAAVLTYHIGTELYADQVLGKGVAVPKTRAEVALKAWELAGKPAVELNGEPLSEAAQAEKWAVESGLMQNVDGSFNGQKKMNKLKALRVLDAAKKLNAQ